MKARTLALAAAVALLAGAAVLVGRHGPGEALPPPTEPYVAAPGQVERGAYLALAGNCAGCHTDHAHGGAPYAGGRAIETPFGAVYASNLTPDPATGLGDWSVEAFRRALRHGLARDGRLLAPAFPYPNYTLLSDADAEALYAYLRSLPPVPQPHRPSALRFPYGSQAALAVWRTLFFRPGGFEPEPARDAAWNRGAYLVRGLAHCSACHAERNALGGALDAGGGLLSGEAWYAPALDAAHEAGVADWSEQQVVDLLATGASARGNALGPMAEVVVRSTQHLSPDDLRAMAVYLRALPQAPAPRRPAAARDEASASRGERLYAAHCASCHGDDGQGAPGLPLPLAGRRGAVMDPPANAIRLLLGGGYLPATAGNPRPHGMPPFVQQFGDAEIADVLTYVRSAWGHQAAPVTTLDVLRLRAGRGD
jgi:mono/diheme cytochrome c family protein